MDRTQALELIHESATRAKGAALNVYESDLIASADDPLGLVMDKYGAFIPVRLHSVLRQALEDDGEVRSGPYVAETTAEACVSRVMCIQVNRLNCNGVFTKGSNINDATRS